MNLKDIEFVKTHGFYVYVLGNIDLLKGRMISVAGTRQIHKESALWLSDLIKQANMYSIVSGLALGTDTVAHSTALKNNIPTIAVLPSGFNQITPYQNRKLAQRIVDNGGLLITKLEPDERAYRDSYIDRNQIIAKLGESLIVPQFNSKSGTMHTVNFARDYKKHIFVQNVEYPGNQLIIEDDSYKTIIK